MKLAKTFVEVDTDAQEPAETSIKGFMPIGSVEGSGSVHVSAFEVLIPRKEIAFHAVRFEISSGGDYPQESIATVAAEHAERLIKSLDQLAGVKISTNRFALTEVESVVDGLRVVAFNTDRGQVRAAVSSGIATCHLTQQSDLFDLSKLVSLALDHLRQQDRYHNS